MLLSLTASAKQHQFRSSKYLNDMLTELSKCSNVVDLSDLLPDAWAKATHAN